MLSAQDITQFESEGYCVVEELLNTTEVNLLKQAIAVLEQQNVRDTETVNWTADRITMIHALPLRSGPLSRLMQYRAVLDSVETLLGTAVCITGGIMLDKDPLNNWDIDWHQDTGIHVKDPTREDPTDIRGGIPVLTTHNMELENNITCRIALDGATADNGGLYVLPCSHRANYGGNEKIRARFSEQQGVLASQTPGSALFYRPLLLHRSEKSRTDKRRRIFHLSFGPTDLSLPDATLHPWPQPIPLIPLEDLLP